MADGKRFGRLCFKRIGLLLCTATKYLVVGLLTIVNNGNIWSDGRDPRIRYRRYRNEM